MPAAVSDLATSSCGVVPQRCRSPPSICAASPYWVPSWAMAAFRSHNVAWVPAAHGISTGASGLTTNSRGRLAVPGVVCSVRVDRSGVGAVS